MQPLVSILIPAFNAAEFIAETIRSALAQTWPHKEIIVVDDESRDQTRNIAQQFASKNVMVVTQPNQGAAAARNKAFSLCQGDYIQWLDADDLLDRDKIAKQLEEAQHLGSTRRLLSSSWGRFIYRVDRANFSPTALWHDLAPADWLVRKLQQNIYMQTGTWLVSRELTEAAGPWDTRLLGDDDGEYFCRVLLKSEGVRFILAAKMYYRMAGNDSLSYIGRSNKKLEAQFLSIKLHIGYLRSLEDSERVRAACLQFLQGWLIHFYPERPDIAEQMQQLAADLGGSLKEAKMPWKYAWIQKLFGWNTAKRTKLTYNRFKSIAMRSWDKLLGQFENRSRDLIRR